MGAIDWIKKIIFLERNFLDFGTELLISELLTSITDKNLPEKVMEK